MVDFLVAVAPLTLDATNFARHRPDSTLREEPSTDSRRTFVAADGEFAYSELTESEQVDMWSTALPVATTLQRVKEAGLTPSSGEASVVYPDDLKEYSAQRAWEQLRHGPAEAEFLRIDLADHVLVWAPTTYPKHVDHGFWPGRIGIQSPSESSDPALLQSLLTATATPGIAEHAAAIANPSES